MKDVLVGVAVAVGVVVIYKMFLAPPSGPPSGTNQGVNPTLAGVAGIVGAAGGLIDSIGNLVHPPKTDDSTSSGTQTARIGRFTLDQPAMFGGANISSGYAVIG